MSPGFRSLMWYLLLGTRGGPNRRRILDQLQRSPANAHQLSAALEIDYRTVRHHLKILERNGAVTRPVGDAYATPYAIAPSTSAFLETLEPSAQAVGDSRRAARPSRIRTAAARGPEGLP
jgi:DNA-binding transcriptional ArsR family regulator